MLRLREVAVLHQDLEICHTPCSCLVGLLGLRRHRAHLAPTASSDLEPQL